MKKSWRKRLLPFLPPILLVGCLVFYTKTTIDAEVNETLVYVTKVDIPPRTKITEDMIVKHSTPSRGIPLNAVTNPKEIVGKWTVTGYGLSKNSFFYKEKIVNQNELPDAGLLELKEGEMAIPLLVDLETSLGNSIVPDTHLNLNFSNVVYEQSDTKIISGPVVENVRVVAVKDSQASNVFDPEGKIDETKGNEVTSTNAKTLAKIYIFAVPEELGEIVLKGKKIGEVFPVVTGNAYKTDLKAVSTQNEVIDYIKNASIEGKSNAEEGTGEEYASNN